MDSTSRKQLLPSCLVPLFEQEYC